MTNDPRGYEGARRAVVVGGAGFLGRRLVAFLIGEGDEAHPGWPRFDAVHVADTAPHVGSQGTQARLTPTSSITDVRSKADLREALAGAHTVFHLASIVHVGLSKNPLIDAVNIRGVENVVDVCRELGVQCLVYTSSEDVVLSPTPVAGGDETIPYPTTIVHDYVRTKIAGEKAALDADTPGGLRTCAIRPVHIYGPHDPHAIKVSLLEFAKGRVPFLLGDGSARFDIVYVDNVAHAHLLAAARLADGSAMDRVGGQAFFATENNAPNYFEFIRPYADARNIKMPRRRLSYRMLSVVASGMELAHRLFGIDPPFHRFHLYVIGQDFFFTGAKAERDLGYTPLVSPEEAQRRTVAWIVDEPLES